MIADRWLLTGIAAGAAAVASGILLLNRPETGTLRLPEEIQNAVQTEPPAAETKQAVRSAAQIPDTDRLPQGSYILRLQDNTLFVYQEGEREPLEQYELPAGWLPDYDRILLEYGMRAQSREELRRLLEDYVS